MFTILHMKENEVAEVAALERRCFGSDTWTEEDFRMGIHSPIDTIWVYRDGALAARLGSGAASACGDEAPDDRKAETFEASDLIGYCVLRIIGDEAEVLNLCVAPEYRRGGAGDLLMDVMMQKCQTSFVTAVFLEVRSQNEAARGLYRKHGFQDIDVRKAYYDAPEDDAVIMKKTDYEYETADSCCACGG